MVPLQRVTEWVRGLRQVQKLSWFHRSYVADYVTTAGLFILGFILFKSGTAVEPVHRYFLDDDPTLSYPSHTNTVSKALLVILDLLVPFLCFATAQFLAVRLHELHNATLGLMQAFVLTWIITEAVKVGAGVLRPSWLDACKPLSTTGECTESGLDDERKSFPSGHASTSFACFTFLTLFVMGRVGIFSWWRGNFTVAVACLLPMTCPIIVATTRLRDYRHAPADVTAGAVLGMAVGMFTYLLNFHHPFSGTRIGEPLQRCTHRCEDAGDTTGHTAMSLPTLEEEV